MTMISPNPASVVRWGPVFSKFYPSIQQSKEAKRKCVKTEGCEHSNILLAQCVKTKASVDCCFSVSRHSK